MNFENFEFNNFILSHQYPIILTEDQKEILEMIDDYKFLCIYLKGYLKNVDEFKKTIKNSTLIDRAIFKKIKSDECYSVAKNIFNHFLNINDKYSTIGNNEITLIRQYETKEFENYPNPSQPYYISFSIDEKFKEALRVYINIRINNQGNETELNRLIEDDLEIILNEIP